MGLKSFITNVGLITTKGKYGDNIMACEFTHQLSGDPFQVMVCLTPDEATYEHIEETKIFGVNICAVDQNIIASLSGNNTGKEVDKIGLLKELGVTFYQAKTVDLLMVEGGVLHAECKLIKSISMEDTASKYMLFIGEAHEFTEIDKEPIAYHAGKYFKLGEQIHKPDDESLSKFNNLVKKYTRNN